MRTHSLRLFLLLLLAVTVPILLFGTGSGRADDKEGKGDRENEGQNQREGNNDRAVRLFRTIAISPGDLNTTAGALYSFDISFVDQATQTYYLADRSNKSVDVVDTKTLKFVTHLTGGFRGFTPCSPPAGANDCAGPNGVATSANCLFVTDAPSRVVSFDKATLILVNSVKTDPNSPNRADELAVD